MEEITALHKDMFQFYVNEVSSAKKRHVYSKPVVDAMNFIHYHLHEKLPAQRVAEEVGLSPNYLSQLFKKELGLTVADYVLELRMEAAKNMLRFSSFPYDEIASILAFSSQSHFIQVFKKATGITPKAYRTMAYRRRNCGKTDSEIARSRCVSLFCPLLGRTISGLVWPILPHRVPCAFACASMVCPAAQDLRPLSNTKRPDPSRPFLRWYSILLRQLLAEPRLGAYASSPPSRKGGRVVIS